MNWRQEQWLSGLAGLWLAILVLIGLAGAGCRTLAPATVETGPRAADSHQFDRDIQLAARRFLPPKWDWLIYKALVRQESNFNPQARSHAGALGLAQIMPETAAEVFGVPAWQLTRPQLNLELGARYLRKMWDQWPQLPDGAPDWTRTRFALASYNCGLGATKRLWLAAGRPHDWNRLAPRLPGETRAYVTRIMERHYPRYRTEAGQAAGSFVAALRQERRQRQEAGGAAGL